jgi:assimilatory nitrate reductase catalytic subunit
MRNAAFAREVPFNSTCVQSSSIISSSALPAEAIRPYHWAGRKGANQLTIAAQDPISKIPESKVCAVRIKKAAGPPDDADEPEPQQ